MTSLKACGIPNGRTNPEFVLYLHVHSKYIGLSIGKSGANVRMARNLQGIYSLDLDEESSVFIIKGQSKEICQKAASIIYHTEELVTYPYTEYSTFFAERQILEEIVDKSGIVKLEMFNLNEDSIFADLLIIGKPECIEDFKILLSYQKAEYDEINSLKLQNKIVLQKLYKQKGIVNPQKVRFPRNFADAVKSGMRQN